MEEHFAGNCSTACDNNPNINDALKAVCDTGSQQYCTTGNNIFTPNCKSYLARVTGNAAADRISQTYSNPIKFPTVSGSPSPSAANYYNELSNSIFQLRNGANGTANLISSDMKDLIDILKTNNPNYATDRTYQSLLGTAFEYCATSPTIDANFCAETGSSLSWAASEFTTVVNNLMANFAARKITGSLVAFYSKQPSSTPAQNAKSLAIAQLFHSRMPNAMKPVDDMILDSLTQDDLLDPNLVVLRSVSPYLQTGVDTFIINLINGPKSGFTRERLSANPAMYTVTLNSTSSLYGNNVRTFLANLNAYNATNKITTDPLATLIQMTDNINITTCSTGNPMSNPICSHLAATASPATAAAITGATVAFCSDAKNVNSPSCIAHINGNQKVYNMNDVNTKMLNYCISTSGQNDAICTPFSAITGSDQWLLNSTKNTTNASGVTTSMCGMPGNLTKDTCQSVCTVYPDLCASDIQQKCAAPANRYSTNIDFFQGGSTKENMDEPAMVMLLWILAIVIVLLGAAAYGATRYRKYRIDQCEMGNLKYEKYCDYNNDTFA